MKPRPFYLAVDMDDTLRMRDGWHTDVKDSAEGRPNHEVIALVKGLHAKGWRIILWTCRPITEGLKQWCKDHDVPIDFYNENPEAIEWFREQFGFSNWSHKVFADVYLDDSAFNPFSVFIRLVPHPLDGEMSVEDAVEFIHNFAARRHAEKMKKDVEESK